MSETTRGVHVQHGQFANLQTRRSKTCVHEIASPARRRDCQGRLSYLDARRWPQRRLRLQGWVSAILRPSG
jgi:hypothetical protein